MSLEQPLKALTQSISLLESRLDGRLGALREEMARLRADNDALRGAAPASALPLGLGGGEDEVAALHKEVEQLATAYDALKRAYIELEQRHLALHAASTGALGELDRIIGQLEATA